MSSKINCVIPLKSCLYSGYDEKCIFEKRNGAELKFSIFFSESFFLKIFSVYYKNLIYQKRKTIMY